VSELVLSGGRLVPARSTGAVALREAITAFSRAAEDTRWLNLSGDATDDVSSDDRIARINRARLYRRRSPLTKQGSKLFVHYVLGQGVTLRANNRTAVQRIVDEFWDDPVNKAVFTGQQAMGDWLADLWTDGDRFLLFFPDKDAGTLQLGDIDPTWVKDKITDRRNWRVTRWYKVTRPKQTLRFVNGQERRETTSQETVYYRDWRNDQDLGGEDPPDSKRAEGLVYHVMINRRGKFGEGEPVASLDWLKAHKEFMEDRATTHRAAASIAWKRKRKGGASDVARLANSVRSTLANGAGYEGNPTPAAGSTISENEESTLEWASPTNVGSAGAASEERLFRMMIGSGLGVMNHYFGDEAAANLATATAMELPMLKAYEAGQKLLGDVIGDILIFALEVAHAAERIGPRDDASRYSDEATTAGDTLNKDEASGGGTEPAAATEADDTFTRIDVGGDPTEIDVAPTDPIDWYIDVDFPPIVQKDLVAFVGAVKELYGMMPGNAESQRLAVGLILNAIGTNDVPQVIDRIFSADAAPAISPPAKPGAPGLPGAGGFGGLGGGDAGLPPDPFAESDRRVRRVLRAVRNVERDLTAVGA
jgi:hypothetical protein